MPTLQKAFYELKAKLLPIYDEREAEAIAHEWLAHTTGMDRTTRLIHKNKPLSPEQQHKYAAGVVQLTNGEPLQYVIGEAWFMGAPFKVNKHVLIPRPETEELVNWVLNDYKNSNGIIHIIDIGTGSGCIPITLSLKMKHNANVTSVDVSAAALGVAQDNAAVLGATVTFVEADFLNMPTHAISATYNVIVSNPPYIPLREKESLHENVLNFEPALALFVPNDDPLVFYKAIAQFADAHLESNGAVYCEVAHNLGPDCEQLFTKKGYKTHLKRDINGNWRMLKAWRINE